MTTRAQTIWTAFCAVWLGIYLNNGKMYHMNIGGNNLWVNYSDETPDELAQGLPKTSCDTL